MKRPNVYFLLLTKNEQVSIKEVIQDLRSSVQKDFKDILAHFAIVDDSNDQTPEIAQSQGCEVIAGGGKGLGHAYAQGVRWAIDHKADYIFSLDSDGQTEFSELKKFWQTMHQQKADLVIGSRFLGSDFIKYKYPKMNRLGVYLLSKYLTVVTGQKITDSHGGLRLFRRKVGQRLKLIGTHSYVQVATICAVRQGFKVVEIKSIWKKRKMGPSKVVHSRWKYIRKMFVPLVVAGAPALLERLQGKR